ncbi:MAG: hypothetical protein ABUT20_09475 [Bacteroidota bacterium]
MKVYLLRSIYISACCLFLSSAVNTQLKTDPVSRQVLQSSGKGLFDADDILNITLKGNLHDLLNDRSGEPKNFPITLSYKNEDSAEVSIAVNVKTRGHFRRAKGNCAYPPLLIQFSKTNSSSPSYFNGQAKLKLVMPCRGDEYVVHEWLVYKLYNLVTTESLRARLVRVKVDDEKNNKQYPLFFGMLLEDEKQMAKRNNEVIVDRKLSPEQTLPETFLTMAVFQYLIGNTDWSVQYQQNIKLIAGDSLAVPGVVPYDFDHAGIVNAPYALPAEELQMSSVRERRYRGFCIHDMHEYDSTIAFYNGLKKDIYSLYTTCSLLDEKYIKATVHYLDQFYSTINNPRELDKEFGYPCDKNGTGNVIIRGLKED